MSGIKRDKADKLMYIPDNETQNETHSVDYN